jgi:hypothetical protein
MKNNLGSYFPVDKIIGDYLGVIFGKDKMDFSLSEKSAIMAEKKVWLSRDASRKDFTIKTINSTEKN